MATSGETSPADLSPESRTTCFTRKRTNSHLETLSRTKALKRDPVMLKNNAPQDHVSPEYSSAVGSGVEDEHEETPRSEQGSGGGDDTEEQNEDGDKPDVDSAPPGEPKSNTDIVHGTPGGGSNGHHPTDYDGEASGDEGQISSEDTGGSDAGTDDPGESEHADQTGMNGGSLSTEKTKKELRRERRAARREKKLLRTQQAVKRGKSVRLNGDILELPKGGNGFIGLEYDDEEEGRKEGGGKEEGEAPEEGGEEGEGEKGHSEKGDGGGGLLVGSKGVSTSPTPPLQRKRKPDILSSNNDFVPIDISSGSEGDDKDLHTQRLQQKKGKLPNSISGRNALPTHTVVEISDDEAASPLPVPVSSLGSGEAIAITAPILTFPPPNLEKTVPRLRLLMQYYTPISHVSYPHEEDRDLFDPVSTDDFRIPSPKRMKLADDSPLQEFFQRQVCGVCATEGHEEKTCERLRCKHCFAWDKHFSHACPEKSQELAGSDSSDEGVFNWRRVLSVNRPHPEKKVHPTRLNMGCYACASDHHFGGDCNISGPRSLNKIPWSMRWVEEMGWIDKNAPPVMRGREREGERQRDSGPSSTRGQNQNQGRDSRRDRDVRRDQDPYSRLGQGREWDYERDICADIYSGGGAGRYRPRYGGSEREASPPRGGGYGRDRDRDKDRGGLGRDNRNRTPPPPPPPRSQLPPLPREPLPPPLAYTRSGGDNTGRRGRKGGVGAGGALEDRIRMMPSSGKKEWARFKR